MQSHPLDGDGLNVELFKLLGRVSRISIVNEALPFRIPDTILYYGCASYWYFFDEQTNSVQKYPAKTLEKANVYKKFCAQKETDRTDIVACFCSSRSESLDIMYLDKERLWNFLFRDKHQERYGILQKFVEPKVDHNETVQVVHSPTMTFAVRRLNRTKLSDRTVDINLRCCGFDGPAHQCEEYFCLHNRTGTYRSMCEAFVKFFTSMEPRFVIKRIVAYFRHGADDINYLLFTTSVRIVERVDPELEQLWGKKAVAYSALKQSLANVTTAWSANSTIAASSTTNSNVALGAPPGSVSAGSTSAGGASDPAHSGSGVGGGRSGPSGGNSSAASGGATTTIQHPAGSRLLQPLSLLPKDQLDKATTVPSRAKEVSALAKYYGRGTFKKRPSFRPVPERLLSPFRTVSATPDAPDDDSADTSKHAERLQRAIALKRRAAQLDAENSKIRRHLRRLQRDAASLCMMNELDKVMRRVRSPAQEDTESGSDDTEDEFMPSTTSDAPYTLPSWAADVSQVPPGEGNTESRRPHNDEGRDVSEATLVSEEGESTQSRTPTHRGTKGDELQRTASVANVIGSRMRRRKSMTAGAQKVATRPVYSPRSYSSRPILSILERALTAPRRDFVQQRADMAMDVAAQLSDYFYPLAATVAERRKWIPKYARYEPTYAELQGIVHVDDAGCIHFYLPRGLLLFAKQHLGADWGCLRILEVDAAERDISEAMVAPDGPFGSDSTGVHCVLRPPFLNESSYTFVSQKLQAVAETADREYAAYVAHVMRAAVTHEHFDVCEGVLEHFQKRKEAGAASVGGGGGVASALGQLVQELNPAANRQRRASLLQQLKSAGKQADSAANASNAALAAPAGERGQFTPRSECQSNQQTPRHSSTSPSEDVVSSRRGSASAPALSTQDTTLEPTASARAGATNPSNLDLDATPTALRPQEVRDGGAASDDTPEWLK